MKPAFAIGLFPDLCGMYIGLSMRVGGVYFPTTGNVDLLLLSNY